MGELLHFMDSRTSNQQANSPIYSFGASPGLFRAKCNSNGYSPCKNYGLNVNYEINLNIYKGLSRLT